MKNNRVKTPIELDNQGREILLCRECERDLDLTDYNHDDCDHCDLCDQELKERDWVNDYDVERD
jgi:uncharacterized paraquat-inducible protein A